MSEAPVELRRFHRFPLTWPVAFSGVHTERQGHLGNLSWEGCRVVSKTSLQQGSYLVDLKFQCPEWDTPLSVEMAQVRWAKGQEFGVEFIRLQQEEKHRLRELIKTLETATSH